MDKIIAYCGLVCSDCDAYLATQAGEQEALEGVAAKWRVEYHAPGITAESVLCDGCLTDLGHKCGHCGECDIRACGMESEPWQTALTAPTTLATSWSASSRSCRRPGNCWTAYMPA
jgi:hypothetical protein